MLEPALQAGLTTASVTGYVMGWPTWLMVVLAWCSGAVFVLLVGALAQSVLDR